MRDKFVSEVLQFMASVPESVRNTGKWRVVLSPNDLAEIQADGDGVPCKTVVGLALESDPAYSRKGTASIFRDDKIEGQICFWIAK